MWHMLLPNNLMTNINTKAYSTFSYLDFVISLSLDCINLRMHSVLSVSRQDKEFNVKCYPNYPGWLCKIVDQIVGQLVPALFHSIQLCLAFGKFGPSAKIHWMGLNRLEIRNIFHMLVKSQTKLKSNLAYLGVQIFNLTKGLGLI